MSRTIPARRQRTTWVVAILICLWLAFEVGPYLESVPVGYQNVPFPVDGPVRVGDPIPMHVVRCSTLTDTTDIVFARSLVRVDGEARSYSLGDGRSVVQPGCMEALTGTSLVPRAVTPGRYQVVGVVTVEGRLRTHKLSYRSQTFEVVP